MQESRNHSNSKNSVKFYSMIWISILRKNSGIFASSVSVQKSMKLHSYKKGNGILRNPDSEEFPWEFHENFIQSHENSKKISWNSLSNLRNSCTTCTRHTTKTYRNQTRLRGTANQRTGFVLNVDAHVPHWNENDYCTRKYCVLYPYLAAAIAASSRHSFIVQWARFRPISRFVLLNEIMTLNVEMKIGKISRVELWNKL